MKTILSILTFALMLGLYSCSRCDNTTYSMSNEQKEFASFKTGSYWIMRDSLTGERDSFVARVYSIYKKKYTSKHCYDKYEGIGVWIDQYDLSTGQIDTLSWYMELAAQMKPALLLERPSQSLATIFFSLLFTEQNVAILSRFYNDVQVSSAIYDDKTCHLYLNKSNVILKISIRSTNGPYNRVWELEKSNIIK